MTTILISMITKIIGQALCVLEMLRKYLGILEKYTVHMKYNTIIILMGLSLPVRAHADIALNPLHANGIAIEDDNLNIRMESEEVIVDLWADSAVVNCSFVMHNYGEALSVEMGFPEMHFLQNEKPYFIQCAEDKKRFRINVNGVMLGYETISFSHVLDELVALQKELSQSLNGEEYRDIFDSYVEVRHQLENKSHLWYVWQESFDRQTTKNISVSYKISNGTTVKENVSGYFVVNKLFKYIISTGGSWHGTIGDAIIRVRLHGFTLFDLGSISPSGYTVVDDGREIMWHFEDIEPVEDDDIVVLFPDEVYTPVWMSSPSY